jgi:hypothetical protein
MFVALMDGASRGPALTEADVVARVANRECSVAGRGGGRPQVGVLSAADVLVVPERCATTLRCVGHASRLARSAGAASSPTRHRAAYARTGAEIGGGRHPGSLRRPRRRRDRRAAGPLHDVALLPSYVRHLLQPAVGSFHYKESARRGGRSARMRSARQSSSRSAARVSDCTAVSVLGSANESGMDRRRSGLLAGATRRSDAASATGGSATRGIPLNNGASSTSCGGPLAASGPDAVIPKSAHRPPESFPPLGIRVAVSSRWRPARRMLHAACEPRPRSQAHHGWPPHLNNDQSWR